MGFWRKEKEISPVTLDEFNEWVDDVIGLTRLPNNDSMRFAVATVVLEAKELLSKEQAATRLEKGAQNQFAAFIFQDIKSKRIAEDQARAAAEKSIADSAAAKEAPPVDVQNEDTAARSNEVALDQPEAPIVTPAQVPTDGSEKAS